MNKLKLFPLFFLLIGCFVSVNAQDENYDAPATANQTKRAGLRAQLGLTGEQLQQIRQINQQNRQRLREANQRLREANRNLDEAVYGDQADEAAIETRLKELNVVRAEVLRLRTRNEFAVRQVLTPDQLVIFRDIRRQSLAEKEALPRLRNNRRMNNPNRPLNNLRRRNRFPD